MKYTGTILLVCLNTAFFLPFLFFPNSQLFNGLILQTPVALGGEWWRVFTALLAEDDWMLFVQYMAFLLYVGITFEKVENTS
jgi:membrane associated rhomboid family serine protease